MRDHQKDAIPLIDVFAGPGGLGEGFSALRTDGGRQGFRVALSIEKERTAHRTLTLRSFFRQFAPGEAPEDYYRRLRGEITTEELFAQHPGAAVTATSEAWHAELGNEASAPREQVRRRVKHALDGQRDWVLIGGPPCQAYSIAGRSRNQGKAGYRLDDDPRASLYVQYLHLVADAWPAVFVMENVPGLLSASMRGQGVFEMICRDLHDPARALGLRGRRRHGYSLHAIAACEDRLYDDDRPERFVVHCERFGVPQRRRRVILIGVRDDVSPSSLAPLRSRPVISVRDAIGDLPPIRSKLSKEPDSADAWLQSASQGLRRLPREWREFAREASLGGEWVQGRAKIGHERRWFIDSRLGGFCNHSSRGHIRADLWRYRFAAMFAEKEKRSPSLADFAAADAALLPDHANIVDVATVAFADRFRVQLAEQPATTVTSHISKDGHYYIHYDPMQCRSLTVREAARLQSFPDNYFFEGPRTAQYVQVGNAVPPLLARQVAERVLHVLS